MCLIEKAYGYYMIKRFCQLKADFEMIAGLDKYFINK